MVRTGASVVVVDQHEIFRAGLIAILGALPGVVMAGAGVSSDDAIRLARAKRPDVLLLDSGLEVLGPGSLVREIRKASAVTAVIMLGSDPKPSDVLACVGAGAGAYLLKSAPRDELGAAIQRAVAGEAFIDPLLAGRLVQALSERTAADSARRSPDPLTPREREVLGSISRGRSNKEIASDLSMASGTVKIHVERILRKLSAANRVEAATIGLHHGLIADEADGDPALTSR
jgi:two-component system, NarL family, nitrate/nitrite response regulator NarL